MEPPSSRSAPSRITIVDDTSSALPRTLIEAAIAVALGHHGASDREVCLLLTADGPIQELNRQFRGVDEPTDVLTFPSGLPAPDILGDIAVSVPYADRQAQARGVTLETELAFLAIHGALHLVGFDDEEPADRAEMVAEMNRIAALIGLQQDEEWASILHEVAA